MLKIWMAAVAVIMTLQATTAEAALIDLEAQNLKRDTVLFSNPDAEILVTEDLFSPGVFNLFAGPFSDATIDSFDTSLASQAAFTLFAPSPSFDTVSKIGAAEIGEANGTLQFLFTEVSADGQFSAFDGGQVLVELTALDLTSTSEFFGLGEMTVTALAAIPLPAGGWLLLAGLGMLAAARRRA